MPSLREVMEATMALEKETMGLYARYAKVFEGEPKFRDFWYSMARDEANHVGALTLVSTVLECEGLLEQASPFALEDETVRRLRNLLKQAADNAKPALTIEKALAVALEIEESEIEDRVGELLKAIKQEREYERYQRLLVHDLGDLSYMIECYCQDTSLLTRCDALVERHAEALRQSGSGAATREE
jgi:rubrerythrin